MSLDVVDAHGRVMLAIIVGLMVGKPTGILLGAWLAARLGWPHKPDAYTWRQLVGAGLLAGIGFTMSLFIAGQAFTEPGVFDAAKIAIFVASIVAGALGAFVLWRRPAAAAAPPCLAP